MSEPAGDAHDRGLSCLQRLRERGVLRVALSYTVIAWLLLQIADVVFDPLGVPKWAMTALIGAALAGFPLAVAMAWFLEIGERGIEVDRSAAGVARPTARGLRHYADAVVIGVLLVAVAILAVRQSDLGRPNPPANPAIAVLPFENLSGDPEQEYFSDGLAEEMLDRLGRVPGLRVIARASSFSFKGKGVDAKTIAEKLGVTTVLEGSVRRDGQRLRLKARLIDGATGQQAWSGSFDRELTDVFKLQDELANAVVEAIVPAARGEASAEPQAPTSDLNAYDYYLLARTQLALRLPETIRKSVELAQQAVERDPKFARAYAQLASSLIFLQMLDRTADPDEAQADLRRAEAAIHQALALDPKLSEAYGALANLQRETGRPGAEDSYKHAIDLNPNNAAAWHDYSVYLSNFANRPEESIRATARSLELDPRQPVTWANYLDHVAHEGRARFEAELTRAIRSVGDMPGAVARFGLMIWAHDADSYRREFAGLVRRFADTPGALDGQVFPVAVICGFPVEIMLAAEAKARKPQDGIAPLWALEYRAWQPVDPGLAATRLPAEARGVLGLACFSRRMRQVSRVTGSASTGSFSCCSTARARKVLTSGRSWPSGLPCRADTRKPPARWPWLSRSKPRGIPSCSAATHTGDSWTRRRPEFSARQAAAKKPDGW
jgi:adenylate cyclase